MSKCESTSERIATLASDQMRNGKKNERSVAASAMRARKRSGDRRYSGKRTNAR